MAPGDPFGVVCISGVRQLTLSNGFERIRTDSNGRRRKPRNRWNRARPPCLAPVSEVSAQKLRITKRSRSAPRLRLRCSVLRDSRETFGPCPHFFPRAETRREGEKEGRVPHRCCGQIGGTLSPWNFVRAEALVQYPGSLSLRSAANFGYAQSLDAMLGGGKGRGLGIGYRGAGFGIETLRGL